MKINKLKIKNILGVQEINFEPGDITLIQGKSGSGKTSILEALQRSITGKSERDCFVNTATDEKGEVYIVMDDIELVKKFNKNGKTITKLTRNNATINSPNTYMKSIINELQLNPIELIKMSNKDLTEMILSLIDIKVPNDVINKLGVNVDNDKHGLKVCEEIESILYEKRTEINREVKLIVGEIEGYNKKIPNGYDLEYAKNINLKKVFEEISESNKINSYIEKAKHIINEKENKIKAIETKKDIEIKNLMEKIEAIKENAKIEIEKEKETALKAEEYIKDNQKVDIEELETSYKEKESYKSYVHVAEELINKRNIQLRKEEESKTLTKKLEIIRNLPSKLLSNVEMPVDNLQYKNGQITINERPIINLSGGERIKFVMNIVRKISGNLKLILINGFESLNENEQKHFIENCQDDGFQYFITKTCDEDLNLVDLETGEILK